MKLKNEDIKVDTYTPSNAVRMTHMPTGVAVLCDRSEVQHRNKTAARLMLEVLVESKDVTHPDVRVRAALDLALAYCPEQAPALIKAQAALLGMTLGSMSVGDALEEEATDDRP